MKIRIVKKFLKYHIEEEGFPFSEWRKFRKPFSNNTFEKEEWYELLLFALEDDMIFLPKKLKGYMMAYIQWFEKRHPNYFI